ncbi:MAG: cysteine--tRNA ligase [Ruminococcaceae bacterium]|nr:cysteine--tRNA ligase [Oscillospiraceae bacterium]
MRFYNTMTRQKEEFTPIDGNNVTMYACGPTVYNFFHIGNARCFTVFDMLRRTLEYRGYNVKFVQNFTDIDDKMIKKANEQGTTVKAIAEEYIKEYFTDAQGLGITPASVHPKATENIAEIIALIEKIIENGAAYESNGDVYFRTKCAKNYGKLSHMNIEDLESGARIDVSEQKEDPMDFALWKAQKPGEPAWESPWGMGRPGWHIECSAMSCKYLGETIDIHCGGQDLQFPHHENEIAQSEAATGKTFVKLWMHVGFISVDNQKMSKSLNNFFTVRDVAKEYGYQPIRFFLLSSHYRSPVNYSEDIIKQSKAALERIYNCKDNLEFYLKNAPEETGAADKEKADALNKRREQFVAALDDDFNTADAISVIFELVRDINALIAEGASKDLMLTAKELFDEFNGLFGFKKEEASVSADIDIESLIAERAEAKKSKNYARADEIRAFLLENGIILEDTAQGTKYKFQ